MQYIIEEKVPYIIMGGRPISNAASEFEEVEFFDKMRETIGDDKFNENEAEIRKHLEKPDSFIEFGDFIFRCR